MASGLSRRGRSLQSAALELIDKEPPPGGLVPDLARGVLRGCAGLYSAGLEVYLRAEDAGLRRRSRLPIPVVSIGNLSVGGTGKTPFTQWLVRKLQEEGLRPAVLSRGHGSRGVGVRVVDPSGGDEYGDEPLLLARTLSAPVLIGKDRRQSGREAMRRYRLDVLVLDDGFQYWQLARDVDIVLLDGARPFHNGHVLPRGLLREPAGHLRRASAVVVTRSERLTREERAALVRRIEEIAPKSTVLFAGHRPEAVVPVNRLSSPLGSPNDLKGVRVVALSGIAQPAAFRRTLEDLGAQVLQHIVCDDHAEYGRAIVEQAQHAVCDTQAEMLIMTEKDAVKWPALAPQNYPCSALRIEVSIEDPETLMRIVRAHIPPKPGSATHA